jgi:hypothetical protein
VNWRKGFNRVFVVVTVAWAAYVPFIIPMQQRREMTGSMEKPLSCA